MILFYNIVRKISRFCISERKNRFAESIRNSTEDVKSEERFPFSPDYPCGELTLTLLAAFSLCGHNQGIIWSLRPSHEWHPSGSRPFHQPVFHLDTIQLFQHGLRRQP